MKIKMNLMENDIYYKCFHQVAFVTADAMEARSITAEFEYAKNQGKPMSTTVYLNKVSWGTVSGVSPGSCSKPFFMTVFLAHTPHNVTLLGYLIQCSRGQAP